MMKMVSMMTVGKANTGEQAGEEGKSVVLAGEGENRGERTTSRRIGLATPLFSTPAIYYATMYNSDGTRCRAMERRDREVKRLCITVPKS